MLKFRGTGTNLQLLQMLYLNPPLYNMNRERLQAEKEKIVANYNFFSPLHRRYGLKRLESFEWLSEDRLFQKTVFEGGLEMAVNFSGSERIYRGVKIKPGSVAAFSDGRLTGMFTPEQ